MMCKKIRAIFLFFLCYFSMGLSVAAESNTNGIPDGEILIVYSDDAKEQTMESVREIVKILTYQNFEVSFASTTESVDEIDRFSDIICYQLETYPKSFLQSLREFEDSKKQILFIGNACLKEYLDVTDRTDEYMIENIQIGKLRYAFSNLEYKEALVEEDFFLFMNDIETYRSGEILIGNTTGYFCASFGNITHISVTDMQDELIKAAVSQEIGQWKWPYLGTPHIYPQYMLLEKVYPFEDPEKLLEIIQLFIEKEEPFVISVMPVYVNGDYPAMQRFCELLRYAQANGGAIIMHAPINQMNELDQDVLYQYLKTSIDIYMSHGVYPMALEVPANWIFCEDTIAIMSHFRTIFTTEEEDEYITLSKEMVSNVIFKDGHQWISEAIELDDFQTSYVSASATAVHISMQDDMQDIEKKIAACQESVIPSKSLWENDHSFWTEDTSVIYTDQKIFYNGTEIDNKFSPTDYEENYNYHCDVLSRFSRDLTSENHKLVIVVSVISVLFLLFILLARYSNRKKFLIDKRDLNDGSN